MERIDQLYAALATSRRALDTSDRMLRAAYDTMISIDTAVSRSRLSIAATRERLAESLRDLGDAFTDANVKASR